MINNSNQSQTLQTQVYEYLHNKIVSGDIPPGQRVVEQKIVEETGVSRSPIREAIRRLSSEGLVTVHPRGGVRVYRATNSDFKYLYECRLSLEPTAAYLAAIRINDVQLVQFNQLMKEMKVAIEGNDLHNLKKLSSGYHDMILEISGNPYLKKLMNQLNSLILFYRNLILNSSQRLETGSDEHEAIWQAICERDAKAAETLMREHIKSDYQFYISKYPESSRADMLMDEN
ncbi:GntR family transcriptional regulator [Bacillus sp. FJAT-45350]|uniref:GntR family transcriptional regulator n=1 Tax=Bacillus sp. FJAT-45350 TaxID=2011014 RepID=UPI000BB9141B|nr:GntR family transcriptional regulator [Bacillus sp. FJAT-45350]